MAAPPRVPPTLLSLAWEQQAWRRIRSVHGRSTSGSTDQGQRPDGGVAGTGAVCCFCLRSLHVSSAPPVARLLFHSDLGQTVCSHTWSTSSFRRMYSCSAGEVVCAPQAKSDGKSQLDEVIHSKHISNLLCVGSLFCSEFVVGVSLLLSTWILSWMRATRRARSPSGPATASTISRQFLFSEDSNEVPSGCCGSRWHGEETTAWGRQRHRLLQKSTPKTAAPPRAQVPIYSESLQTTVPTGSSKGGAEEAGQRWGRGRRPDAGQRTSARGSRHRQREGITAAAEGSGDRGLVKSRSDSCGREKRPGTRAGR